jgi:hypothetical protein
MELQAAEIATWAKRVQEARAPLVAALQEADEKLSCMWSSNETSRANLAHTCAVQASDILRAALSQEEPTP